MSRIVLDTNVISYLMRGRKGLAEGTLSLAERYRPYLVGQTQMVSFMTVAELYEGAYRKGWGAARLDRLETILKGYIVIPASPSICQIWARIRAARRLQPIAVDDAWIAATALAYSCSLLTHNPADFQDIPGLTIVTAS